GMHWTLNLDKNVKLNKIYLLGPKGKTQKLLNPPPGVKIVRTVDDMSWGNPSPYYEEPSALLEDAAMRISSLRPCTRQGPYYGAADRWTIGPESSEWRAQMILAQIGPLHKEALSQVKNDVCQWFRQ